jgi:hypothetical protein
VSSGPVRLNTGRSSSERDRHHLQRLPQAYSPVYPLERISPLRGSVGSMDGRGGELGQDGKVVL